ncbi:uncharacterized protein BJ171DRAFT_582729 [Polychytrium aggregatum]|uniref:uncharacterized protein n=1 Tax=Polychytrium aggregatum TaxID=110093 RepID=UPI0022FE738D|nr:uncharacterized protein BJ171DRAFT_582729 [Polychytrium aggregatum]KAI9203585.1 hypothetical protein BJ171DRAFT_582729 [Polychytrium aggregatum]
MSQEATVLSLSKEHILKCFHRFRQTHPGQPFVVAVSAPQGSGKTTLTRSLESELSSLKLGVVSFSVDDFYLTFAEQNAVAQQPLASGSPNALLQYRGNPGTHDVELGSRLFAALTASHAEHLGDTAAQRTVSIPIYDKALNQGRGDRLSPGLWRTAKPPFDIILFEGWCLGFRALSDAVLVERYSAVIAGDAESVDPVSGTSMVNTRRCRLEWLQDINARLRQFEDQWYPFFECFVHIIPDSISHVYRWRIQQENSMRQQLGQPDAGLTDDQVRDFVDRFMPLYELMMPTLCRDGLLGDGRYIQIHINEQRACTGTRVI